MGDFWGLLSKLFDHKRFYLAAAFGGGTVLALIGLGYIGPFDTPLTWLVGGTIFAAWMSVINGGEWAALRVANWISVRRLEATKSKLSEDEKKRAVTRLDILTPEQRHTLLWLRHHDKQEFQGWHNDGILRSLRKLKLIEEHEETLEYYSRYVVPAHIWNELELDEEQIRHLGKEEPWKRRLKRRV